MALTSFSPCWLPQIQMVSSTGTPTYSGIPVTTSAGTASAIFRVPRTGTLDKFEFMLGTPLTVPSNGVRCAFKQIDLTTGDPGSEVAFRVVTDSTVSTNTWCVPGVLTDDGTDSGIKWTVTRGDILCCNVSFQSFNTGDTMQALTKEDQSATVSGLTHFPYQDQSVGGTWTKRREPIAVALKYNDGTYAFTGGQVSVGTVTTVRLYNTGTAINQRGIRFTVPAPIGVGGAWVRVSGVGDWTLVLYDQNTAVLASVANDKDVDTSGSSPGGHFVWISSDIALSANTVYRLIASPTSATSFTTYDVSVSSNAILGALETGITWYHTERSAGTTTWTDDTARVDLMGLLVTQVDDGAGGTGTPYIIGG